MRMVEKNYEECINIYYDSIMWKGLYLLLWEGIQEIKVTAQEEVIWPGPTHSG